MIKLFDKLDKFLKDAEAGSKSAAKKGADVLRGLADWLENLTAPLVGAKAKGSDTDDVDKLEEYCQKVQAVSDVKSEEAKQPIGATPKSKAAMGPGLAILLQVLAAALQAILARKKEQANQTGDDTETKTEDQ